MKTPIETKRDQQLNNIFDGLFRDTRMQVSHYLSWGLTQIQIAEILGISQQVVSYHRRVLRKLFNEKEMDPREG